MDGPYLAVVRLRKPHGLKGDVVVWVLTDHPDAVLVEGRELTPVDEAGRAVGEPRVIERSRAYHRHWLLKFEGVDDRTTLEGWGQRLFGVPAGELTAPAADELYVHEIPGAEVVTADGALGTATGLVSVPGGALLAIDVDGREVLVPFRRPIVKRIDRASRRIELDAPPGLFEV